MKYEELLKDCIEVDSNCECIGGCNIYHIITNIKRADRGIC